MVSEVALIAHGRAMAQAVGAIGRAVPWLRRFVADSSAWFGAGQAQVGLMVDTVTGGQVLLRVLPFSPVRIIPTILHTNLHLL